MSDKCALILKKAAKDILSQKDAEEIVKELRLKADEAQKNRLQTKADAVNKSVDDYLKDKENQLLQKKHQALKNIQIYNRLKSQIAGFKNPVDGLHAYLSGIQTDIKNGRFSTDAIQKNYIEKFAGKLLKDLMGKNLLDLFRDKNIEGELARELFESGISENANIREIAAIIKSIYKDGISLLNKNGADIHELEEYITRQTHDIDKLESPTGSVKENIKLRLELKKDKSWKEAHKEYLQKAFDRWKDFISPRLDEERTFSDVSDRDKFLHSSWDALRTGIHLKPDVEKDFDGSLSFKKPGNLADRLSSKRKLHFKDGKSWYEYNKEYGSGNVQLSILHSIRGLGKHIGLLETWGPNPRAMFEKISTEVKNDSIRKMGMPAHGFFGVLSKIRKADSIFKELDGSTNIPVNNLWAKISSSFRAWESMSKLGQVFLSSLSDLATRSSLLRDHDIGLLDSYSTSISELFRGKVPKDKQILAATLGTWAESQFGHMIAYFHASDTPAGAMTKAMQKFFKLTGMTWLDQVNRTGIAEALSHHLALISDNSFENLSENMQRNLRLYGIESKEWDLIRNSRNILKMDNGKNYITPDAISNFTKQSILRYLGKSEAPEDALNDVKNDIETRLRSFFIDQTDMGQIRPDAADKAFIINGSEAGTLWGEIKRFVWQFKYFTIAFTKRTLGRMIYGHGAENLLDFKNMDIQGIAHLIIGSTILGYVAMSAKAIMKGEEPRIPDGSKNDLKILTAAFLQGGGMGIYGDFLFGESNRFGGGIISTAAGPALGTLNNVAKLAKMLKNGDDPSNMAFHLIKNNMPFLNLWFTRTALDYLILYGIQERIAPGSLQRMINNLQKNNNQQFLISPLSGLGV